MTQVLRETHVIERDDGRTAATTDTTGSSVSAIARVIYFIAGVITGLLALRFVLAMLGANPANPFADFIYTLSYPLVAPFAGLFNYKTTYGVSRFELETLVAMAVYALLALLLVKLLAVVTNSSDEEMDA